MGLLCCLMQHSTFLCIPRVLLCDWMQSPGHSCCESEHAGYYGNTGFLGRDQTYDCVSAEVLSIRRGTWTCVRGLYALGQGRAVIGLTCLSAIWCYCGEFQLGDMSIPLIGPVPTQEAGVTVIIQTFHFVISNACDYAELTVFLKNK